MSHGPFTEHQRFRVAQEIQALYPRAVAGGPWAAQAQGALVQAMMVFETQERLMARYHTDEMPHPVNDNEPK